MNAEETYKHLVNMPNNISILLEAMHGVGKSSLVKKVAEDLGIQFVDIRLSQSEVGDVKGYPNPNHEEKSMEFYKPYWWPKDMNSEGILFFDELNRADPSVLQCVFEIFLDRRLDGTSLPDGWKVVTAVNGSGDYQVVDFDPALSDRWFKIEFEPTVKEWVAWGRENGIHPSILEFVTMDGKYLDPPVGALEPGKVYPSRRSWDKFNQAVNAFGHWEDQDARGIQSLARGFLGIDVAASFPTFLMTQYTVVRPEDIYEEFDKHADKLKKITVNLDEIAAFSESYIALIKKVHMNEPHQVVNYKKFLRAVPSEIVAKVWSETVRIPEVNPVLSTFKDDDPSFLDYLFSVFGGSDNSKSEEESSESSEES